MEMKVASEVKQASFEAVVIRCGCGSPESHKDAVCPTPREVEDMGTVAYYHKNPLSRMMYRLRRRYHPNAKFWVGEETRS